MIISRILHAGYIFEDEGARIAFDPIFENPFSRNCYAFPLVDFDLSEIRELRWDAVFISHHHDDHCSLESLDLLDRATPIYVYCPHEELRDMLRKLGFRDVRALEVDQSVKVGAITVTPRLALDPDVDSIFHIEAGGVNVLNVVDAWIDPSALRVLARSTPWDVVLWPFQTMREIKVLSPRSAAPAEERIPHEWIEQLQVLQPRVLVPSSCQFQHEEWSWLNRAMFPVSYARFAREIGEALPDGRVVRLEPGDRIRVDSIGIMQEASLPWVKRISNEIVDYDYDPAIVAPPTGEIAKRFPGLSPDQTHQVLEYCRTLVARSNMRWRLTVWDHLGEARVFESGSDGPVEWTTDVPISRLHGALNAGESLTSMYIRINEDIQTDRDPLEDPLVKALFDGAIGSYQRAQLESLVSSPNSTSARRGVELVPLGQRARKCKDL